MRHWSPVVDERFARHTLTVNYRTTAEILQAAEPLLTRIAPEQRLSRAIRHGGRPAVVAVAEDDMAAVLDEVIAHARETDPEGLIGVVTTAHRPATLDAEIGATSATVIPAPDATRATRRLLTLAVTTTPPTSSAQQGESARARRRLGGRPCRSKRPVGRPPRWSRRKSVAGSSGDAYRLRGGNSGEHERDAASLPPLMPSL